MSLDTVEENFNLLKMYELSFFQKQGKHEINPKKTCDFSDFKFPDFDNNELKKELDRYSLVIYTFNRFKKYSDVSQYQYLKSIVKKLDNIIHDENKLVLLNIMKCTKNEGIINYIMFETIRLGKENLFIYLYENIFAKVIMYYHRNINNCISVKILNYCKKYKINTNILTGRTGFKTFCPIYKIEDHKNYDTKNFFADFLQDIKYYSMREIDSLIFSVFRTQNRNLINHILSNLISISADFDRIFTIALDACDIDNIVYIYNFLTNADPLFLSNFKKSGRYRTLFSRGDINIFKFSIKLLSVDEKTFQSSINNNLLYIEIFQTNNISFIDYFFNDSKLVIPDLSIFAFNNISLNTASYLYSNFNQVKICMDNYVNKYNGYIKNREYDFVLDVLEYIKNKDRYLLQVIETGIDKNIANIIIQYSFY